MVKLRSIRSYLHANGLCLSIHHSIRQIWIRVNSAMLARNFNVRGLTVEPPYSVNGSRFINMGENFSAGPGLWLEAIYRYSERSFQPRIVIGANVSLSHNVHIAATNYVEIGADVLVGSRVFITDHNHGSYGGTQPSNPLEPPSKRPLESDQRTVIGDRVWLGDGVVVAPGATIGDGAVIGANSVVVGSIPGNSVAAGAPAKVLRTFDVESLQWLKEKK
jgi:acetyltransferase-like isoleucine patch superfamily enzyme